MVIFKGTAGVRSGWRFAGFLLLTLLLLWLLQNFFLWPLANALRIDENTLNSSAMLLDELAIFVAVMAATGTAAWLEHRPIDSYGLPRSQAFRGKFWEGIALGAGAAGLVAAGMYFMHGFVILGFGLHGAQWLIQPLLWAAAMLLVGIAEEYWFRGYLLQSLARGIGFWPAAIATTLVFAGLHLTKNDENFVDIFNIVVLGILTCLMLRRTGSLWLAVGFHAAFDFMQFFVIGTRNGGNTPVGVLFKTSFPGPAWVNGGPLGTEASYFMFPVMAALYAYVLLRYREDQPLQTS